MSAVAAAECSSCVRDDDRGRERERDDDNHDCVGEGPCEAEEEQVEDSKFNAYCKACIHPGRATPKEAAERRGACVLLSAVDRWAGWMQARRCKATPI